MKDTQPAVPDDAKSTSPIPPVLAPTLMMVFWMLLGGAAGIKMMESNGIDRSMFKTNGKHTAYATEMIGSTSEQPPPGRSRPSPSRSDREA
jgi:hypothetical protein